jgi:hypothetical protein
MYEDVEEYECSVLPDETEHAAGSELVVEVHTDNVNTSADDPTPRASLPEDHRYNQRAEGPSRKQNSTKRSRRK